MKQLLRVTEFVESEQFSESVATIGAGLKCLLSLWDNLEESNKHLIVQTLLGLLGHSLDQEWKLTTIASEGIAAAACHGSAASALLLETGAPLKLLETLRHPDGFVTFAVR